MFVGLRKFIWEIMWSYKGVEDRSKEKSFRIHVSITVLYNVTPYILVYM
jgi:hypothetical protein